MNNTVQIFSILCLLGICLAIPILAWKWKVRRPITDRLEALSETENREATPLRVAEMSQGTLPKAVALLNPVAAQRDIACKHS